MRISYSAWLCPVKLRRVLQGDLPLTVVILQRGIMPVHDFHHVYGQTAVAVVSTGCNDPPVAKAVVQLPFIVHKHVPVIAEHEAGVARKAQTAISISDCTRFFVKATLDDAVGV